jgi:hypothetical protein
VLPQRLILVEANSFSFCSFRFSRADAAWRVEVELCCSDKAVVGFVPAGGVWNGGDIDRVKV